MVLPLKDENPTRRPAVITIALIAINLAVVFLIQQSATGNRVVRDGSLRFDLQYAAIPCEVAQGHPLTIREAVNTFGRGGSDTACDKVPASSDNPELFPSKNVYLAVVVSMFLHADILHVGFNMLFLWVFGNNIEDTIGRFRYVLFYLLAGLVAAGAHILVAPDSTVPVIGASGAIAGVMGAYLVWFPRAKVNTLFIFVLIFFQKIEARWLLLFWFASQFFLNRNSDVAWVAHVGGFLFGALVAFLLRDRLRPSRVPTLRPAPDPTY